MTALRCATLVVRDVDAAVRTYGRWLDYSCIETGAVPDDLAHSWGAPLTSGRRYAVMQPVSRAEVLLRFVEGDPVRDYRPLRTYGWAATEICVQDVERVHERMLGSGAFEVIGPPRPLDGFPNVKPMQVRGPDDEIVYLTEFPVQDAGDGLPRPQSEIDRPFILVLAAQNLERTANWLRDTLGYDVSPAVPIRYTMISRAFGLPIETKHAIVTAATRGEVCLEADQYPEDAMKRPAIDGALPPGVAIVSLLHADLDALEGRWMEHPTRRDGAVYGGARTGVLQMPEGALIEIIEDSLT